MQELPRPLALVMIDLDNFKLANTLYGHVGGDRVLCRVADVLRRSRATTTSSRASAATSSRCWCVRSRSAACTGCPDRVVSAIRDADTGLTPPGYRLTASVGYALVEEGDADVLLEAADRRLRRAKDGGKDRWIARRRPTVRVQAT